ncbi:sulfatase [Candidatus Fermentibacterales bacterium]|nr:sulfatase [Candidatus Fermentibacterales bacterium]
MPATGAGWTGRPLRAALLAALLLLASSCGVGTAPGSPNLLLVLIDTLRADHLGCYGYERNTTPCLDSLAAAGLRFERVHGSSSWTLPAMSTILTGLPPREHGAGRRDGAFYGLSSGIPGMARILHASGYSTAAFFNVVFMSEDFGFHVGFDHFDCRGFAGPESYRDARGTVDDAIEWLREQGPSPFFLAVHFYDPHITYDPPAPFDTLFTDPGYSGEYGPQWGESAEIEAVNAGEIALPDDGLRNLIDLYDGEIAFTDHEISRLLSFLRGSGLSGNTVVIVAADHGEEFLEHGMLEHGSNLYQTSISVPLLISGQGIPVGEVERAAVSHVDILPTVIALTGGEAPEGLEGCNLLGEVRADRFLVSSGVLWGESDLVSVRRNDSKIIWRPGEASAEAYDLAGDAGEFSSLMADSLLLEHAMSYWATPFAVTPPQVYFGESAARALRDLGYIR